MSAQVFLKERPLASETPSNEYIVLYGKPDGLLYFKNDLGVEYSLTAGSGDLLADGTIPMTADWDMGAFTITAGAFVGDGSGLTGLPAPSGVLLADGSVELTANWDVGGFNITNVGAFTCDAFTSNGINDTDIWGYRNKNQH